MSLKSMFQTIALGGTLALVAVGVVGLVQGFNHFAHPASQGQEYLQKKGFSNVSGGQTDHFNTCGKNVYARSYKATDPATGKTGDYTVCFSLFGPSRPWFGN